MLVFQFDREGLLVAVFPDIERYTRMCWMDRRDHELLKTRWEIGSLEQANDWAAAATRLTGRLHVALDRGEQPTRIPRYDVIEEAGEPFEGTPKLQQHKPRELKDVSYVFLDPADREKLTWRAYYCGRLTSPCFNSKGAAAAYIDLCRRGHRHPEYEA